MGLGKALVVLAVFCFILYEIATGGKGIPATGLSFAPDPNSFYSAAGQKQAEANALYNQGKQAEADIARQTQVAAEEFARQTQVAGDQIARQTQAAEEAQAQQTAQAQRETQIAQATATQSIVQITLAAAQVQLDAQATAQAIKLADLQGQADSAAQKRQRDAIWENIKLESSRRTAWFTANWALWIFLVFCAILTGIAGAGFYWLIKIKKPTAYTPVPMDEHGNSLSVVMENQVINPNHMTAPVLDPRLPAPIVSAPDAKELAKLYQARSSIWGLGKNGYRKDAYTAAQQMTQSLDGSGATPLPVTGDEIPDDVSWSIMRQWPGKKWTFGQGARGEMISLDPDDDSAPHILGAGTTGSGKSHYLIDPLIPQALASNRLVVALARSGVGLNKFAGHPNFRTILLDHPDQAIGYLEAAYEDIIQRQRLMAAADIWKWSMWPTIPPAPALLMVMDEFSDLADELDTDKDREQLWRFARMVAAEGRKAGVLLAIALQDPTHKSIDLRIRRNCTPVAFRVQDEAASHVILRVAGAEKLAERHFMTRLGGRVVEGVAFDVTPQDIQQFLTAHPVPALPAPKFLDCLPAGAPTPASAPTINFDQLNGKRQQILDLHSQGKSLNEIQRTVFGFTGGAAYNTVKAVLGDAGTSTTTTDSASTAPSAPAE